MEKYIRKVAQNIRSNNFHSLLHSQYLYGIVSSRALIIFDSLVKLLIYLTANIFTIFPKSSLRPKISITPGHILYTLGLNLEFSYRETAF